jgi:acetyl esterase/lipase
MYSAIRALTADFSPLQHQYRAPSTDAAYESFCASKSLKPDSEILQDGTKAHWIGPRTAKKLIIHFHGGGYVLPAAAYTFTYLHGLREALRKSLPQSSSANEDLVPSVLVLSYDLSPGAVFPRQLIQATALLQHIFQNLHIAPRSIILSGDSAGGNLALALLSHIAHPHPSVPKLDFPADEKFLGVVLLSPWADFETDHQSFETNVRKDDLTKAFLTNCSESFLGTKHPHERDADTAYTQPDLAPVEWWKGVPADRDSILITGGEDELLIDGVKSLAKNMSEGLGAEVELSVVKDEAHEGPLLEKMMGETEGGVNALKIEGWVRSKL